MSFDPSSKRFRLCFDPFSHSDTDNQLTEIFVSFDVHYPNGADVQLTPNLEVHSVDEPARRVLLKNKKLAANTEEACAVITPK